MFTWMKLLTSVPKGLPFRRYEAICMADVGCCRDARCGIIGLLSVRSDP